MNRVGNIGILLAGIGILCWGISGFAEPYLYWLEFMQYGELYMEKG